MTKRTTKPTTAPAPLCVHIRDLRRRLSEYTKAAAPTIITHHGRPTALLLPLHRTPGSYWYALDLPAIRSDLRRQLRACFTVTNHFPEEHTLPQKKEPIP